MKKVTIAVFATALSCALAFAQGPPGGPHRGFGRGTGPGPGMHHGKTVTGTPYSATVTNSNVETLADGNTIEHTTTGSRARDSQGREYEQMTFNGDRFGQSGPTTLVFINDPVAGYAYTLNASTKVASRHTLKTFADGLRRRQLDSQQSGPFPRGPRANGEPDSANLVSSDLGTQAIGGVTATGKSVTHTVPAGAVGNAQPLVSTSEVWTSPDLQIEVMAKRSDPRFGQSTYSLSNIQRAEPAASLFQVPSDYTIKDAPQHPGGPPPPLN